MDHKNFCYSQLMLFKVVLWIILVHIQTGDCDETTTDSINNLPVTTQPPSSPPTAATMWNISTAVAEFLFWAMLIFICVFGCRPVAKYMCCCFVDWRTRCDCLNRCAVGRGLFKTIMMCNTLVVTPPPSRAPSVASAGATSDAGGIFAIEVHGNREPPPDYETALDMPVPQRPSDTGTVQTIPDIEEGLNTDPPPPPFSSLPPPAYGLGSITVDSPLAYSNSNISSNRSTGEEPNSTESGSQQRDGESRGRGQGRGRQGGPQRGVVNRGFLHEIREEVEEENEDELPSYIEAIKMIELNEATPEIPT